MVAAKHACNQFISQFDNALIYSTPEEFSAHLIHAAENQPKPLSKEDRYQLSWEAATERCVLFLPACGWGRCRWVSSSAICSQLQGPCQTTSKPQLAVLQHYVSLDS